MFTVIASDLKTQTVFVGKQSKKTKLKKIIRLRKKTLDLNYHRRFSFEKYKNDKKLEASLFLQNLLVCRNFMINWIISVR